MFQSRNTSTDIVWGICRLCCSFPILDDSLIIQTNGAIPRVIQEKMNKIGQKFIVCCLSYFDAIVFMSEDILDRTYISYMPYIFYIFVQKMEQWKQQ